MRHDAPWFSQSFDLESIDILAPSAPSCVLPWERRTQLIELSFNTVGSFFRASAERLPRNSTGNQPTMSLRGLKAWFGRGAAEEDEDETMVRDPNV